MNTTPSIWIYDRNLTLCALIDTARSVYFERQFFDCGSFSFETNENLLYSTEIQIDRLVIISGDEKKSGIITEIERREGPNGRGDQIIVARGVELKGIFDWRYVQPAAGYTDYIATGPGETIMKGLVASQAGASATPARAIPILSVAVDSARGEVYALSTRWKLLSETLRDVAIGANVGHSLTIDLQSGALVYDCSEGVDRRASQSVNGRAIFSTDYDTIENSSIKKSNIKYRNVIYSAGQGIGDGRNIRTVYAGTEPAGLARKEQFCDAKTLSSDTDIDAMGGSKLQEYAVQVYVEGQVLSYSQLKLGTDYDLGDMVTVESYGESINPRIVAVKESWAAGSYKIDLTFDRNYPDLMTQLKSITSEQARLNNAAEGVIVEESHETTASSGFSVKKYASGEMVIDGFFNLSGVSVNGVYGSLFISGNVGGQAFPEAFHSILTCLVVPQWSNEIFIVTYTSPATVSNLPTYRLVRAASATVGIKIDYHAVGRWRE